MAPKVLKEIREPSEDGEIFGPLIPETEVKILNRIQNTDAEIDQVKRGMHYVYYGANGTARNIFAGKDYDGAGKTGTAQAISQGIRQSIYHMSVLHHMKTRKLHMQWSFLMSLQISEAYPYAQNEIVEQAVDEYFKLKAKRAKEETSTAAKQPIIKAPEIESK